MDAGGNHARPRDAGELKVRPACSERLDQMRAQHITGSFARYQPYDRRDNRRNRRRSAHAALANNAAARHSQKINQWLNLDARARLLSKIGFGLFQRSARLIQRLVGALDRREGLGAIATAL